MKMRSSGVNPRLFSIKEVSKRLDAEYGRRVPPKRLSSVTGELVRTILSQNTNDVNSGRAFSNLRKSFATWEELAEARPRDIARAIRIGGLAEQKSKRIKAILRGIYSNSGSYSLAHVCRMPMEEARDYLLAFKGVGEKTAACVLLFSCGMPAFPVDTHILRVSKRLGWLGKKTTADKAHLFFRERVERDDMAYGFHLNLIMHGRTVCHARKPECGKCCLKNGCLYYQNEYHGTAS